MARHHFPVFTPDGINRVADNYECESVGYDGADGAPVVLVRLGTTGLYMAPADAVAFADLILTEVAVADIEFAKKVLGLLPNCIAVALSHIDSEEFTKAALTLRDLLAAIDRDTPTPVAGKCHECREAEILHPCVHCGAAICRECGRLRHSAGNCL